MSGTLTIKAMIGPLRLEKTPTYPEVIATVAGDGRNAVFAMADAGRVRLAADMNPAWDGYYILWIGRAAFTLDEAAAREAAAFLGIPMPGASAPESRGGAA